MKHEKPKYKLGRRVVWDYFGAPEGWGGKKGIGNIVCITTDEFKNSVCFTYDILHNNEIEVGVPQSCILDYEVMVIK